MSISVFSFLSTLAPFALRTVQHLSLSSLLSLDLTSFVNDCHNPTVSIGM